MVWSQIVFGALLVATLLLMAVGYGWRQFQLLRRAPNEFDDATRLQRQLAPRRLLSCALLLTMACLLACQLLFLEVPAQHLADERDAQEARGEVVPLTTEQRAFARVWASLWIAFLLALLGVVVLALCDVWVIRGFARQQFRKLRDERRAMVERQAARLRRERGPPDVSLN